MLKQWWAAKYFTVVVVVPAVTCQGLPLPEIEHQEMPLPDFHDDPVMPVPALENYRQECQAGQGQVDMANLTKSLVPACATCRDRCGQKSAYSKGKVCSCDRLCDTYRDCCPDFHHLCPAEKAQRPQFVPSSGQSRCRGIPGMSSFGDPFLFIGSCASDPTACVVSWDDPTTSVPAYDSATGIHYVTYRCAACNGVQQVVPWNTFITCNEYLLPYRLQRSNLSETMTPKEFSEIWTMALEKKSECRVYYRLGADSESPRECFPPVADGRRTCSDEDCPNPDIRKACLTGDLVYTGYEDPVPLNSGYLNPRLNFWNIMCLLCNKGARYVPVNDPCSIYVRHHHSTGFPPLYSFSLRLLFDVDLRKGLTVGKQEAPQATVECPSGQVWVPQENSCRNKVCLVENCTTAHIFVQIFIPEKYRVTDEDVTDIELNMTNLLLSTYDNIKNLSLTQEGERYLTARVAFYKTENSTITGVTLENMLLLHLNKSLPGVALKVHVKKRYLLQELSQMNCSVLEYSSSEYKIDNTSVITLLKGRKIHIGEYVLANNFTVYVCAERYENEPLWTGTDEQGLLTLVLTSLSILALLTRIVLHFFVPVPNKVTARIQLCLVGALLVAMISFLIHPMVTSKSVVCYVVAVATHFFFLAAFSWMTVVAFDIVRMLIASQKFLRVTSRNKSFVLYSLFAWGFPVSLVSITIGIDFSDVDLKWKPQYANGLCWITNRYGLLIYFVVPAVVDFLLNVIFFITSVILLFINRSKTVNEDAGNEKHRLLVHTNLLVLMGVTWTCGFLAIPLWTEILWYIFIILNAAQGIFLLVTFMASGNVRNQLCQKRKHKYSSKSSGTRSTSL